MIARALAWSLGLVTASQGLVAATPASAARIDWSRKFSVTPDGGYRMGNPAARIAIVEYASLVCPHCRHFAQTALKPLVADYVRTGKASYEFRPLVLNGLDIAAITVARCGGPSRFFPIAEDLYATQPVWTARIDQDQYARLLTMKQGDMLSGAARLAGLTRVGVSHGIPAAKVEACVRNEQAVTRLAQIAKVANERGIRSTPTFLINGERADVVDWATLEPYLKKVGG